MQVENNKDMNHGRLSRKWRNWRGKKVFSLVGCVLVVFLGAALLGRHLPVRAQHLEVKAEIITAATCSQVDVQAAIDSANEGGTVIVPEGTCTWTEVVKVGEITSWAPITYESKAITLQGAGIDKTIIINEVPQGTSSEDSALIVITEEGKPFRITGFTFQRGREGTGDSWHGTIRLTGTGKNWRIDHNKFYRLYSRAIETSGDTLGVIDHNEFITDPTQAILIGHSGWGGQSYGDGSWTSPLMLGTEQAIYIEDNVFTWDGGSNPMGFIDCIFGGRFVFRYNGVNDANIGNHGTESSGRNRSCFSYEIYENTFSRSVTPNVWTTFFNRGGTGVMFNNTIIGNWNSLSHVATYREFHSFTPWGACDGTSPYDVNDGTTYDSGDHTGSANSSVLVSSGKHWDVDQWVGYSVLNITKGISSAIVSNTADTITFKGDPYSGNMTWDTGDRFEIKRAYPCIDQVGRSTGDLISEYDPPSPQAWPNQALEPFYEWNNTINGEDVDIVSDSPHLIEGRDFVSDTARPGYMPYVYPHPLTQDHLPGDVNLDGRVDFDDVQSCIHHILGFQDWGEPADVNGDRKVNAVDVQWIVNLVYRE
jgi:hypothetical protein